MATPVIRFRIEFGRAGAVGPGKIALLERIGQCGSLSQAARELRMSYRRAWQLLRSLNASFREPVALCSKGGRGGGGAQLTTFGRQLISTYRGFDLQTQRRALRQFARIARYVRARRAAVTGHPAAPVRRLKRS
jgi:molybdate transport system regulatory protein